MEPVGTTMHQMLPHREGWQPCVRKQDPLHGSFGSQILEASGPHDVTALHIPKLVQFSSGNLAAKASWSLWYGLF